jgi:hypothetical protein
VSFFGTNKSGEKGTDKAPTVTRSTSGGSKGGEVKTQTNSKTGETNNYYGGAGKADGKGHSHTTLDKSGNVTYHREGGGRGRK